MKSSETTHTQKLEIAMRTQIFSLLTFALTISACSVPEEAETQSSSDITIEMEKKSVFQIEETDAEIEPSGFVIVDASIDLLDIPDAVQVDVIPEIDGVVYELDYDAYVDQDIEMQEDKLLPIDNNVRLADSDLGDALRDDKNRVVGFIGSIPKDIEDIGYDQQHRLVVFAQGEEELYESELIRELVRSTQAPMEFIHVPVPTEEVSEMLESAIEYAQISGVLVFDLHGELF